MRKTQELPFFGSYGFAGENPFRYTFLHEEKENLEEYKKQLIKCLKYDILYHLSPDHKTGNETYDALRPPVQLPVQLDYRTFARVFHESVRGSHKGEIVVTYHISDDGKNMELTIYDRDTNVELVTMGDEDGPLEYAIVDNIIESKLTITKGKKISTKDIEVYNSPTRKLRFDPDKEPAHNYEESMKVIGKVKEKTGRIEFTNHLVPETQEKTDTKKKGI